MTGALADRCWEDLTDRRPTVLVPLGSCEQHGPHLPLDTDSAVATAVARRAATALREEVDVLVAATQQYTASGEHEGFPGTVSIGHDALRLLLVELGRSLTRWAARVVLVNGHGGNLPSLREAVTALVWEGRDVAWWPCGVAGGDAHAGRTETSVMLALRPESVDARRARAGRTEPIEELMPELVAKGVRRVSPNGVLGDPAGSSAREGRETVDGVGERLAAAVLSWRVDGGLLAGGDTW